MKTQSKILIFSFIFLFSKVKGQDYYYEWNKKVSIEKVENKFVVTHTAKGTISQALLSTNLGPLATKTLSTNNFASIVQVMDLGVLPNLKERLKQSQAVKGLHEIYKAKSGEELGICDQIVLKFKPEIGSQEQDLLLGTYALQLLSKSDFGNVYSVGVNKSPLRIANAIFESGKVLYAHPDFIMEVKPTAYTPNDPFFSKQFYLHNTGQIVNENHSGTYDADVDAPEAWDITKGDPSLVIAVLDEGVSSNHPDLPNTRQLRLNGSNFAAPYDGTNANDPSPIWSGNHGNACAGIIAATQDNSEGVSGIAPNCKIMPIRIPLGSVPSSVYASAIDFAKNNGAKILSNSWGFSSPNPNLLPDIVSAIQSAVNVNRVVVFAAGNTADAVNGYQGEVIFPANTTVSTVITVGASDRYDKRANYSPLTNTASPYNQVIDLAAPSHRAYPSQIANESFEIWTIDIPGPDGYNPWPDFSIGLPAFGENLPSSGTNYQSYTGRMGGTSAAAPLTAGIAALLLSVNPTLTNQQVYNHLTCSSDDVGGYTYANGYSNEMGHGRANAFNALMSLCLNTINITWTVANPNGIKYQASNLITLNNAVPATGKVELGANNSIILQPGTIISAGSSFKAVIKPCQSCVQFSSLREAEAESDQREYNNTPNDGQIEKQYKSYPNPITSGHLHFGRTVSTYSLTNSTGTLIQQGSNTDKLDVKGLTKGMYMLILDDQTEKVIVQ